MTLGKPVGTTYGKCFELCVSGEVDLHTVPDIERQGAVALSDPGVLTLALDLSNVTFIDSTGIGTLVRLRLSADEHHKHLVLTRPSAPVLRLLAITALTSAFTIGDAAGAPQSSSS
jgi:anti-sigma B factor antagonist